MKHLIVKAITSTLVIGLFAVIYQAQFPGTVSSTGPAAYAGGAAAETLNAVVKNTSSKNVLIWQDGFGPKKLTDVPKFHLGPGMQSGLKVTLGANGQVRFVAGAGSSSGPDYGGDRLGSCTWTRNANTPNMVPYIVYSASGLSCKSIAK